MTGNTFTTVSAGALGQQLGLKINDAAAANAAYWLERGNKWLLIQKLGARIEFGRAAKKLKEILGMPEFKKTVKRYWLSASETYEQKERWIQESIQLFEFSKRKGPKLTTDMPADSYIKIMQFSSSFKYRQKNKLIKRINRERSFEEVSIENTKPLREKLRQVRNMLGESEDPDAREFNYNAKVKSLSADVMRCISSLEKTSIELRSLLLKKNDFEIQKYTKEALERLAFTLEKSQELPMHITRLRIRAKKTIKKQQKDLHYAHT
ncbi:MAG: hypothetical protein K2Q26_00655 [Bdellovibrionales bacterium]|nr:hypothetical protein [Bdellovibrionales bacterium]